MNRRLIIPWAMLTALLPLCASAWSSKGHRAVAVIAQRHLTAQASQSLMDILDGDTPAYVSTWMDIVASQPQWSYTKTWHYLNMDEGETYETRYSLLHTIDAVMALDTQMEVLADEWAEPQERLFAAKCVIHIVGDIHQPLHAGHHSDLGGNTIGVTFYGDPTNLHSVWDYGLVEQSHPGWSYIDWAERLDTLSAEQEDAITAGDTETWAREAVEVAAAVYAAFPQGVQIGEAMVGEWRPMVEQRILRGGLRLAKLLNAALDPALNSLPEVFENQYHTIFNLQGLKLDRPFDDLPPGIYIVDGRKVLRK